jgi:hypothetical protein
VIATPDPDRRAARVGVGSVHARRIAARRIGARRIGVRIVFGLAIFAVLAVAISSRPTKRLNDFDQSFYLTIAFDLLRHQVFSNGIFDDTDSTLRSPPPGMFFGPIYPALVAAIIKVDPRFARAVECAVETNHGKRVEACDIYARPVHLLHALLLAIGVLAIGFTAELIFGRPLMFYLAGALATVALVPEADLFSYIMTESATFALYGLTAAAMVWGLKTRRGIAWLIAGFWLGLLVLTRPSFVALGPVIVLLAVLAGLVAGADRRSLATAVFGFCLGFAIVVLPWTARNAVSVGKWGLTEEYGALSVIERFAFNRMTAREFVLAFPYCVPGIGAWLVEHLAGPDVVSRFDWRDPKGFFSEGRARRLALVAQHGRLDPVIGTLAREELRANWWRHLVTSLPLAWCGLWIGGLIGLVLIPLFVWAGVRAARCGQGLFLLYAIPPLIMVGLHAAVANHYSRYNLILIGPASVGAAWIIAWLATRALTRPSTQSIEKTACNAAQD